MVALSTIIEWDFAGRPDESANLQYSVVNFEK